MKEITEVQINRAAELDNDDEIQQNCFYSGAKWMQKEMQQEWIPVSERLPVHPTFEEVHVLTYGYDDNYVSYFFEGEFYDKQQNDQNGNPIVVTQFITHWMPLPDSPKI
ncbi:DUF551 domain-containing protein [Pedobacter gandavensis]|uniref:DUF551 domain-containing protein n=1 Tax=Pedobacter gandavensis TaxID=2679963 RepID=A0ABR6EUC0_9SPHI|nr:DUF551 domain-containing protein [Pedobacter gandavensis]MBB2148796.1 DUF551 domain-containing protein [Pedobacter gandavensis]